MAKDLEPGDVPFEIPEFNEDEYVRKELISFRTTAILFVFSFIVSLLTLWLYKTFYNSKDLTAAEFFVIVIFAMALGGSLPFLFRALRIDISHFKRREWIGTMSLHFFFWLGFTLLLMNPPLNDNTAPHIEADATPNVQGVGFDVKIGAYVADNDALDDANLHFCVLRLTDPPARFSDLTETQRQLCTPWTREGDAPAWTYTWKPDAEGTYYYFVEAKDRGGLTSYERGVVNVTNPFPTISGPLNRPFAEVGDRLYVRADAALSLVAMQYQIGGVTYNMTKDTARENQWFTSPEYPGWKVGDNQVTILAQEQPVFLHTFKIDGQLVRHAGAVRNFTVAPEYPDLGKLPEPKPNVNRPPNIGGTPGPGALPVLLALAATVVVLERTRRHERR